MKSWSRSFDQDSVSSVATPKIWGGLKCLILGESRYFAWATAFQSTKWL